MNQNQFPEFKHRMYGWDYPSDWLGQEILFFQGWGLKSMHYNFSWLEDQIL
jgi:hypothetical protein